jgi:hypothetical protein
MHSSVGAVAPQPWPDTLALATKADASFWRRSELPPTRSLIGSR